MKLKITWENGDIDTLTDVNPADDAVRAVLDGKIFQTIQVIRNANASINFTKARMVQIIYED